MSVFEVSGLLLSLYGKFVYLTYALKVNVLLGSLIDFVEDTFSPRIFVAVFILRRSSSQT